MKRFMIFPCVLCLVIGLLVGILLPIDLSEEGSPPGLSSGGSFPPSGSAAAANSSGTASEVKALDPMDNAPLLNAAFTVGQAIRQQSWSALASCVHPERGVTFTPYSTVDPESDLTFSADQIRALAQDQTVYTWGFEDGRGDPIKLTIQQYFERYVWDADYTMAPEIGVDHIMTGGNALENLAEEYPGCRFVDFSYPSTDPVNDGLDWTSLKLVFQPGADRWYLVGIVHGEWTI